MSVEIGSLSGEMKPKRRRLGSRPETVQVNGSFVEAKRVELNLSQEEFSALVGISKGYSSIIERRNPRISLDVANHLASVLKVTPDALVLTATAQAIESTATTTRTRTLAQDSEQQMLAKILALCESNLARIASIEARIEELIAEEEAR